MKHCVLALAASVVAMAASAETYQLSFSAVVQSVAPGSGLPEAGSSLSGATTFSYEPGEYVLEPSPPSVSHYRFSSPYAYSIDFGNVQRIRSPFGLEVLDDDALYVDPQNGPIDAMFLVATDAAQNAVYFLTLIGPTSSFTGTQLLSPATMEGFWDRAYFSVLSMSTQSSLLVGNVTALSVSPVPEAATAVQWIAGLSFLGAAAMRRRRMNALEARVH